MTDKIATSAILAMLGEREADATICPSEVARRIASDSKNSWRAAMPRVHEAVDHLAAHEWVALSWKGKSLSERRGPYRISRGQGYVTTPAD
ncbi:MAG TPA: DUF3253 domain-containing protein [Erythrobacter sp.]|nr:DUF3253 domain-containing protein [Erythrobacter sp.]